MLKALALHLRNHLEKFYTISYQTGATKADSWVDIEGGIGNLFANASLRRKFPDETFCIDGESHNLSKNNTFMGTHILVPKEGVALHINAFNFPVWGMLEKIAVNLLAGVPAIVKPATVTSYLTEAVVKEIIASGILPEGALQLAALSVGGRLATLDGDGQVRVADAPAAPMRTLGAPVPGARRVAISPDGRRVAVGTVVLDVGSGAASAGGAGLLDFAPDDRLVCATADGPGVLGGGA